MSEKTNISIGGLGLPTMLTILLVILKLTENIDCSWIWVFSPLWICALIPVAVLVAILAFALAVLIGAGIVMGIVTLWAMWEVK